MALFESCKSCFYALLVHPTETKLLVRSHDNNYYLPSIKIERGIWLSNVRLIKDVMEQKLNISVNVLHYANYQINKKQRQIQGIYILEKYNPIEEIEVGTWCDLANINSLSFTKREQKSIIEQSLIELKSNNIPIFNNK